MIENARNQRIRILARYSRTRSMNKSCLHASASQVLTTPNYFPEQSDTHLARPKKTTFPGKTKMFASSLFGYARGRIHLEVRSSKDRRSRNCFRSSSSRDAKVSHIKITFAASHGTPILHHPTGPRKYPHGPRSTPHHTTPHLTTPPHAIPYHTTPPSRTQRSLQP